MIVVNPERFRTKSWDHQIVGTLKSVNDRLIALFDETGAAKTKQMIDAACCLYEADEIDTVIVIAPAQCKSVWLDPDPVIGDLAAHCWVQSRVYEYASRMMRHLEGNGTVPSDGLTWVITSYEFIRYRVKIGKKYAYPKLDPLLKWLRGRKVKAIADESWAIKNHKAAQTKAAWKLGEIAKWRAILNGTPTVEDYMDWWSQFHFLDPDILGRNFFAFRNRYARMGGYLGKQIIGFQNLPELIDKTAPYVLRRLKIECMDLPEKLPPTMIEVPLSTESWRLYMEMREEMIAYLNNEESATASAAGVKALRMAQITSGFLGGIMAAGGSMNDEGHQIEFTEHDPLLIETREVGREKTDAVLEWILRHGVERPIVWSAFRAVIERFYNLVQESKEFSQYTPYVLYGGQSKSERREVKLEAKAGIGKIIIFGQPQAGGVGLTMTSIHHSLYEANTASLKDRKQSEDRTHRGGQRNVCSYTDFCAVGPKGQKTVDHLRIKQLRKKEDMSTWSTTEWRRALQAGEF